MRLLKDAVNLEVADRDDLALGDRGRPTWMCYCLSGALLVGSSMISLASAAAAEAFDCEALKSSAMPYELQMRQANGTTREVQIYRGKNLSRLQYTEAEGHLITSRFQANFQLEYGDQAGLDERFTYSVPTDRYIWQQDSRVVTYKTIISGAPTPGPGVTQSYELLPDAAMALRGCSFMVKHFRFSEHSPEKSSVEDVWFSPDLMTNLRVVEVSTFAGGKTTTRSLEAAAITIDFAPLR